MTYIMENREFKYIYENNGSYGRRLQCRHNTDIDGFKPPFLHCHTEYEFMLIVSGDVHIVNNILNLHIEPPCILLHRPYSFHVVHAERSAIYERYLFYFDSYALENLISLYPRLGMVSSCNDLSIYQVDPETIHSWKNLLDSFDHSSESDDEIRAMYVGIALGKMLDLKSIPLPESNHRKSYIQDVIEYIHKHISDKLSAEALSQLFFVSRSKLIRDFTRYASCSIHEYITTIRLDYSCQLLRAGKNVTDTAMECGFNYVSSYIRIFRQRFGVSPLKYAEYMRND